MIFNFSDCIGQTLSIKELQYVWGYFLLNYSWKLEKPVDNLIEHCNRAVVISFIDPEIGVKIKKLSND